MKPLTKEDVKPLEWDFGQKTDYVINVYDVESAVQLLKDEIENTIELDNDTTFMLLSMINYCFPIFQESQSSPSERKCLNATDPNGKDFQNSSAVGDKADTHNKGD